jgi:hypothetical protein
MSIFIPISLDQNNFDSGLATIESSLGRLGTVTITWNEDALEQIRQDAGAFVDEKALEVGAAGNPPVDTGFLRASVYVHSSRQSTFSAIWPNDYYYSRKQRRLVARVAVGSPEQPPDEYGAVVGWAAEYAPYIEDSEAFAYAALMSLAGAEDRGPLNLGGRRFVSPRGARASSQAQGDYIDRNNPRFVSPDGPSSGRPADRGVDRDARTFVSPEGPAASRPADSGIDRNARSFVSPDSPRETPQRSNDYIDRRNTRFVSPD